MTANEVKRKQ